MKLDAKNIFLLDGVGALVTAISMALVLPFFFEWMGIPIPILYSLACLGIVYAVYSFCCYGLVSQIKPWMLGAVMAANLTYCLLSFLIVVVLSGISLWGRAYLIGEILIVLALVAIEARIYQKNFRVQQI